MISIETQVSGSELGRKLESDREELAYALVEIADYMSDDIGEEVEAYMYGDSRVGVIRLLRNLLAALEGGAA